MIADRRPSLRPSRRMHTASSVLDECPNRQLRLVSRLRRGAIGRAVRLGVECSAEPNWKLLALSGIEAGYALCNLLLTQNKLDADLVTSNSEECCRAARLCTSKYNTNIMWTIPVQKCPR